MFTKIEENGNYVDYLIGYVGDNFDLTLPSSYNYNAVLPSKSKTSYAMVISFPV